MPQASLCLAVGTLYPGGGDPKKMFAQERDVAKNNHRGWAAGASYPLRKRACVRTLSTHPYNYVRIPAGS